MYANYAKTNCSCKMDACPWIIRIDALISERHRAASLVAELGNISKYSQADNKVRGVTEAGGEI